MIALQNMRMSCDSTYLLDHETDFGVKADELATLLEEVLEQPGLEGRRLQPVAADARAARPAARPASRSTTCCSTAACRTATQGAHRPLPRRRPAAARSCPPTPAASGLNLQHASVVVNMDLPVEPGGARAAHRPRAPPRPAAAGAGRQLRRRRARSRRACCRCCKFKKSLFAGVLDGGEREVFLGGSRLTRFMETVEKTTAAIHVPPAEDRAEVATQRPRNGSSGGAACRPRASRDGGGHVGTAGPVHGTHDHACHRSMERTAADRPHLARRVGDRFAHITRPTRGPSLCRTGPADGSRLPEDPNARPRCSRPGIADDRDAARSFPTVGCSRRPRTRNPTYAAVCMAVAPGIV